MAALPGVDRNKSVLMKAGEAPGQHGIKFNLQLRATKLGMPWLHCQPAQMHACVLQKASSIPNSAALYIISKCTKHNPVVAVWNASFEDSDNNVSVKLRGYMCQLFSELSTPLKSHRYWIECGSNIRD